MILITRFTMIQAMQKGDSLKLENGDEIIVLKLQNMGENITIKNGRITK